MPRVPSRPSPLARLVTRRLGLGVVAVAGCVAATLAAPAPARAQSDLDEFMARVLARRDDNWKRLQQYILDEHETAQVAAGGLRLFGLRREYTWFIKDGFFVRSPVRFDGVTLSDEERRRYEAEWVEQERAREAGAAKDEGASGPVEKPPDDLGDLLRQTREPRFVSAAYFLRFKFEPGRYAFVGRESFAGRQVLRIEYYPERLFGPDDPDSGDATSPAKADTARPDADVPEERDADDELEKTMERKANKVALITLWVEPETHQIVKYTFDNVGLDFLPGRWLVRLDSGRASMRMKEAFPGVWLPEGIDAHVAIKLAAGTFTVGYDLAYRNYRQADVKVQVR